MTVDLTLLVAPVSEASPAGADCTQGLDFFSLGILGSYLADLDAYNAENRRVEELTSDEEIAHATTARADRKRQIESRESDVKAILERAVNTTAVIDKIVALSTQLLTATGKDLRVVQHLCFAWTLQSGLAGYVDGLALALALVNAYPDSVFPLPDDDDPEDISERTNSLSEMANGDRFVRALRGSRVASGGRAGKLHVRDIEVLAGILEPDNPADPPSESVAAAALAEGGDEAATAVLRTLETAAASLSSLGRAFGGGIGVDRASAVVKRSLAFVRQASNAGHAGQDAADDAGADGDDVGGHGRGNGGAAGVGSVRSRSDARRAIQLAVQYFEQNEPSHPAPLLLKRADRLMGLSFYEILRDMAPDSLTEIDRIAGTPNAA